MDIDNTLIPYDIALPNSGDQGLLENIQKIGFRIILISNNCLARVRAFTEPLGLSLWEKALKPFGRGYRRALKMAHFLPMETGKLLPWGDQLMTDVLRRGTASDRRYLVKPLKKGRKNGIPNLIA